MKRYRVSFKGSEKFLLCDVFVLANTTNEARSLATKTVDNNVWTFNYVVESY